MTQLRSPLPYVGGKYYSRKHILEAFPPPTTYTTYCEPFCGACHILLAKPPYNHLEVVNDYSKDLVNFWIQCRNHPEELQQQIDTLPYARSHYEDWQESLYDNTAMTEMERAVRWFYVLRSSIGGRIKKGKGDWGYAIGDNKSSITSKFRSATALLKMIAQRFNFVEIECQDFEKIITTYERPSTFFYVDPPYIGAESYYTGVPPFTLSDHERLARLLNNTPAQVALSYYPHEALEEWYPASRWRRVTWQVYKSVEKTRGTRKRATEMLLCNYPEPSATLWDTHTTLVDTISSLAGDEIINDDEDIA